MIDRGGDQGFSVAPRRLVDGGPGGGRRGRRSRIAAILVAIAILAIVTIAWLGPRLSARPNFELSFFATPVPSATPTTRPSATGPAPTPGPTPLPLITNPRGVQVSGSLAVVSGGFRVVDLNTGATVEGPPVVAYRDAVFRAPDGDGWTCICFDDAHADRRLGVVRIAPDGRATPLGSGAAESEIRDVEGVTSDIDTSEDRRHAMVVTSTSAAGGLDWSIAAAGIDVVTGRVDAPQTLGTIARPGPHPTPTPSDASAAPEPEAPQAFIDGPHVRMSPDGRFAWVWAVSQRIEPDGSTLAPAVHAAWRITLADDGSIATVDPTTAFDEVPLFCFAVGFIGADRVAWACPAESAEEGAVVAVRVIDRDGRPVGDRGANIPNLGSFDGQPIFDRANGFITFWGASSLVLTRIDTATMDVVTTTYDPRAESSADIAPADDLPPDWHLPSSAVSGTSFSPIAGIPGSARLYVTAFSEDPPPDLMSAGSLGILVIDGGTLALVDRWAPAALYLSLSTALPGYLIAIGLPGTDAVGGAAPWEASLTLHDLDTGEIVVRYGRLGPEEPPIIVER